MTRLLIACGLVVVSAAAATAVSQPPDPVRGAPRESAAPTGQDVQVSTILSQTALWPGDDIVRTVVLTCRPNIDVLDEDLSQERIQVEGLEITRADIDRVPTKDGGVRVRIRYHLTSYEIDAPMLRISDRSVRYYVKRPGQGAEDMSPAGEVQVPGATLTLRSTLPDDRRGLDLRTGRSFESIASELRLIRLAGIGLLIVSAAPIGLLAASAARRIRLPRLRRRSRVRKSEMRVALDEIRSIDGASPASRREAFARLDRILRLHLAQTTNVSAHTLTAAEITERLGTNGRVPIDSLGVVLTDCERAQYAPPQHVPGPDRLREAVETVERVVLGSSR